MLNTQHYKVQIKGNWSYPGKVEAPSLGVVVIEKGAFWSPSTSSANLFNYIYIYIYIYKSIELINQ